MFHRIKTVRTDSMGREIVEWHGTKEEPAKLKDVARKMLEEYPNGIIEIRYVR